jgi:hypothetical protein
MGADMSTIGTTVTTFVLVSVEPRNVVERLAPKIVEVWASSADCAVRGPIGFLAPVATALRLLSTLKGAKKAGDCSRIGRHDEKGRCPCACRDPSTPGSSPAGAQDRSCPCPSSGSSPSPAG